MKALTVCQPYALLIAAREKTVENRTWRTAYRGPLLIHAGKSRAWLATHDYGAAERRYWPMVFGQFVALAELIDCVPVDSDALRTYRGCIEPAQARHVSGPWCWILGVTHTAWPNDLVVTGQRGLWEHSGAVPAWRRAVEQGVFTTPNPTPGFHSLSKKERDALGTAS